MMVFGQTGVIIISAIAADKSYDSVQTSTSTHTQAALLTLSGLKLNTRVKQKDVKLKEGLARSREWLTSWREMRDDCN